MPNGHSNYSPVGGPSDNFPSFPEYFRQQREREQELENLANSQLGRYQPTRSGSGSPPSSQGLYHQPGQPGQQPPSPYGGSQGSFDYSQQQPTTAYLSTNSPTFEGPPHQHFDASAPHQQQHLSPTNAPDYGGFREPSPPGMQMFGRPSPNEMTYYRERVYQYPTIRPPAHMGADGRPSMPGAASTWGTSGSANDGESDDEPQRKRYTRKPVHLPVPGAGHVEDEPYMREAFSLSSDMDLTLESLREPANGDRPNYPLPLLAALAIHGSPQRKLTLQEIFAAIEARFDWFANNKDSKSWKNSIRHLLSLHKIFRQEARPITEPGKGHYWKLDFSEGVGNKRERKRRPKGAAQQAASAAYSRARGAGAGGDEAGSSPEPSASEAGSAQQRESSVGASRPRIRGAATRRSVPASTSASSTAPTIASATRAASLNAPSDTPGLGLGLTGGSVPGSLSTPISAHAQSPSTYSLMGGSAMHHSPYGSPSGSQASSSGSSNGGSPTTTNAPELSMPAYELGANLGAGMFFGEQMQPQFGQSQMGFGASTTGNNFAGFGGTAWGAPGREQ